MYVHAHPCVILQRQARRQDYRYQAVRFADQIHWCIETKAAKRRGHMEYVKYTEFRPAGGIVVALLCCKSSNEVKRAWEYNM